MHFANYNYYYYRIEDYIVPDYFTITNFRNFGTIAIINIVFNFISFDDIIDEFAIIMEIVIVDLSLVIITILYNLHIIRD